MLQAQRLAPSYLPRDEWRVVDYENLDCNSEQEAAEFRRSFERKHRLPSDEVRVVSCCGALAVRPLPDAEEDHDAIGDVLAEDVRYRHRVLGSYSVAEPDPDEAEDGFA